VTVERVRVGEVLALQRVPVQPDPGTEYVRIGIRSFGKGILHYEPKPGDQLGSLRFFDVQPDRLMVSNIKGWEGAIAVSSEPDAGCIASNRFLSYRPIGRRIDVRWARWFFLSEPGIELVQRASPGSADRNRTLAIDRFEALTIPLPLIDEQRRVAARLDRMQFAVSDLAQHSNRAAALSGALAVSASARPDLDNETKARAGWQRLTLRDVASLNNHEVKVESTISYDVAGVYSFGRGMFPRATLDGLDTSYKVLHQLHAGQFVMSRLKAWEGALALVPAELEGWFVSPEFPTFDVDTKRVDLRFLRAILTSERFWSRLKGASQGIGARRERVNTSRLLDQHVELPPIGQQWAIAQAIDRLYLARGRRQRVKERIDSLMPAALRAAFAGLS